MFSTVQILLICVTAFLICGLIASYKYPRILEIPQPCGMHKPVLLAAQPLKEGEGIIVPIPQTLVLARCQRCEVRYSYMVTGDWSIGELTLKEARATDEIQALEGMIR